VCGLHPSPEKQLRSHATPYLLIVFDHNSASAVILRKVLLAHEHRFSDFIKYI
jgi:hypothetical protein